MSALGFIELSGTGEQNIFSVTSKHATSAHIGGTASAILRYQQTDDESVPSGNLIEIGGTSDVTIDVSIKAQIPSNIRTSGSSRVALKTFGPITESIKFYRSSSGLIEIFGGNKCPTVFGNGQCLEK
jgi:hypothetical protein